jgi:hypothetical protein
MKREATLELVVRFNKEFKRNWSGIQFSHITDEAAEYLASHAKSFPDWNSLVEVSPRTAAIIVALNRRDPMTRGWIALDGLKHLSIPAAKVLMSGVKSKGFITLNGLSSISEDLARVLRQSGRGLTLNGVKVLSPSVAKILAAKPMRWLQMEGLRSISAETAKILGSGNIGALNFSGLKSLSPGIARELRKVRALVFNGLERLDSELAASLAATNSHLILNGVKSLNVSAATALAEHCDELELKGLTRLSKKTALNLAQHKFPYYTSVKRDS